MPNTPESTTRCLSWAPECIMCALEPPRPCWDHRGQQSAAITLSRCQKLEEAWPISPSKRGLLEPFVACKFCRMQSLPSQWDSQVHSWSNFKGLVPTECRRSSTSLQNVDSRTSTPVSSVLTLPVVPSSAWRVPPPMVPSSTLRPSKGGNHVAPHCRWRTCSRVLAAVLAFSGPAPPPSLSLSSPTSPGSFRALEGVLLLSTHWLSSNATHQAPGPTCTHWVLGLSWRAHNLTTMLHPGPLPPV